MLDLDGLLRFAVEHGASDVHVKVGSRPRLRVDGRLREAPFDTVEPTDTERVAAAVIPRGRAEAFADDQRVRLHVRHRRARSLPRERVPPTRLRSGSCCGGCCRGSRASRRSASRRPSPTLAAEQHGLVLVTGLAGSGKTATLAAMVDHVNTAPRGPHRHHRGPGRGAPRRQAVDRRPARGRVPTRRRRCRGSSTRCARTPTCWCWASSATPTRPARCCRRPRSGTSCSRRCRRSARSTPSTASSSCSHRTASARRGRRCRRRSAASSRSASCRAPAAAAGCRRSRCSS